ncbi:hypothetical protein [Sphingomonas suaedae]|uniref:hypothetical protein n=1 Tax=Sphingomonas suaedae TaxID=2599297 RepID=UPI001646FBA4|nr:hypothetical protein [Sphingomonas suaedae]
MASEIKLEAAQDAIRDTKPNYQRPLLIELDAKETAGGQFIPSPTLENTTYYLS